MHLCLVLIVVYGCISSSGAVMCTALQTTEDNFEVPQIYSTAIQS